MGRASEQDILEGYRAEAAELIAQYEALSAAEVLAPVRDLLPASPCRILEIGAGTGRNAAWLAAMGHHVVAVEPVGDFRSAGASLHPSPNIAWIDGRLPELEALEQHGDPFDLVLLIGVWQHLAPERHAGALERLAGLMTQGGRLILSIRHGPGAPTRPCFPCDVEKMILWGESARLRLVRRAEAASIQKRNRDAGVTWTWLCFDRL